MSDFTFACPVCGQHMKCDASQGGTVMECPTCFRKITAPQATVSDEHKFILTGTKYVEKKTTEPAASTTGQPKARRQVFPVWVVMFVLVLLAAGAGIFFLNGKRDVEPPRRATASAPVLSPAWRSTDIGGVGVAGAVSQANGVATLSGSGADIWRRADGFHFVFQELNGNGALTAEVLEVRNTDEWAKGGVMIRETTNASSVFALASIRSDGQAQLIWRSAPGAEAEASPLAGGTGYPKWVKVVRNGNNFSAFFKGNAGEPWAQLGATQTIKMSTNTLTGLIVCSHNNAVQGDAQFDQVDLQADNQAGQK